MEQQLQDKEAVFLVEALQRIVLKYKMEAP